MVSLESLRSAKVQSKRPKRGLRERPHPVQNHENRRCKARSSACHTTVQMRRRLAFAPHRTIRYRRESAKAFLKRYGYTTLHAQKTGHYCPCSALSLPTGCSTEGPISEYDEG